MVDKKVAEIIKKEEKRQQEGIELIPSENYTSLAVRQALGSVFVNKYSEGYPNKRYYGGNENVDEIELLAQERAKKLFNVPFVNIQPYSGSPANLAVYLATCKPNDVIMGQALVAGGHLTHGHHVSATGIFFKSVQYGLKKNDHKKSEEKDLFDYDQIRQMAIKHKPKLIWVGGTAYPLKFHYEKFAQIADEIGAYLAADIAHVAGLIAGGVHPSPASDAHIITTTTHKTLRGPRGAMIMVTEKGIKKDKELPEKINRAVFPGLQGGPHDNQTAAIAVALYEASQPSFKKYARQVVKNAKILAEVFKKAGLKLVAGGTENHLILIDLTPVLGPGSGIFVQKALDLVGLTVNKNTIPEEKASPFYPSGIRLGTPAATTRGMKEKEMKEIGEVINQVIFKILKPYRLPREKADRLQYLKKFSAEIKTNQQLIFFRDKIKKLAIKFPIF
ncbi:MAG: serine hydroxymethyltransferase [Microgenomates group bacterium]|nr:serine hydroxymethyltransferase [Microgenomates group bacterium]